MKFKNFTLDTFQEDSVKAIEKNNSVIVSAPTGSGKTLIADYIIDKELKGKDRVIYTAPIKALSNQKYKDFCEDYGEDKIGLITGDIVINPSAQILIMTTEVYRNMAIIGDAMLEDVSYCIMDEIHYISDFERGHVWEESIIFSNNDVRFLFLSATVPNADEFAAWVQKIKAHTVEVIKYHVRPVPLAIKFFDAELGITDLKSIKKRKELDDYPQYRGLHSKKHRYQRRRIKTPDFRDLVREIAELDKLPCIYFVFSRMKTQDYAHRLSQKKSYLNDNEKKEVAEIVSAEFRKLSKEVLTLKSTQILRQSLTKGIGFHNAGLLPDLKHIVEKLFTKGLIKLLFATETFAVGINMPAKAICIDNLMKYTSQGFRHLTSKEFFQISGRAGRRGMDKEGLSVSVIHRNSAEFGKIEDFTSEDKLPIKSQFKLSYNTILNMIDQHTPGEIEVILKMNFFTFQQLKGKIDNKEMLNSVKARFDKSVKILTKMGYIKDGKLTDLGIFTTKIFSEELEISQIFKEGIGFELNEYQILLLIAGLVYEPKRMSRIYRTYPDDDLRQIRSALDEHPHFKKMKWARNLIRLTGIISPCYNGEKFVDILKNTNLLEGDIIRIFMQVLDRIEQIDKASDDEKLKTKLFHCKNIIKGCFEDINLF